jgi:UDPglucose 6-dehydrogenase
MSEKPRIGFAGLSHLGIIYSGATVAHGFPVVGFDARPGWAEALTARRFPISEPGLEQLIEEHGAGIAYTDDISAVASCKVIFFALDVATDDENRSDLGPLEALIQSVASRVASGTTLVVMSQVPPGYCRKLASQMPAGVDLFYQVETLVFGNAVERAMQPERYMVGCADPTKPFPAEYLRFLEAFGCPLLPMRYESAEICKIAINCFLVSSVTTTNTLAEVCSAIQADWSEIAPALRLDRRIGPYAYLKPGLGIAGGNLERDLVTVRNLAAEHGCDARVVTAWQQNSAYAKDWVLRRLFQLRLLEDATRPLAVWGVAYKPDTHSIKNSPSVALLRAVGGHPCRTYDPVAMVEGPEFAHVQRCGSAVNAASGAAALAVMTPWKEFQQASLEDLRKALSGRVILDPYAALDGGRCRELGFEYYSLGV